MLSPLFIATNIILVFLNLVSDHVFNVPGIHVKLRSSYWHFNTALLHDEMFPKSRGLKMKSTFSSVQRWCLINQLCSRSLQDLETEIVEVQTLVSTGDQGHFEALKSKRLL